MKTEKIKKIRELLSRKSTENEKIFRFDAKKKSF